MPTTTASPPSHLTEYEAQQRAQRIVVEAFPPGRPPRSLQYRMGMTQMLVYFFCGKKTNCLYEQGSPEFDAFFAGCDAGRHHWRLMADK